MLAKIKSFFSKRWVLILLGLLALSLVIYLIGPIWPIFQSDESASGYVYPLESAFSRWFAIGLLFAVWGLVELIRFVRSVLAANRLKHDAAGASPSQAEHQIGQLESAFIKAVESLEKNSKRTGKRSLTELPWYVVLGPSGVGKTELLRTSGLDFPFEGDTQRKYVDGAGGTLNCKWWFTRNAILLDTAGRYVQQDQHGAADRAEWERFLALLKKHRRRQPLNGIVAVISADDAIRDYRLSKEAMRAEADRLRRRIEELNKAFDMRLPVYLVLAKCDLIAGFAEYFRDLNSDDKRAQAWGFDLPADATGDTETLRNALYDGFGKVINRLRHRALTRLRDERSQRRSVQIQAFPEQIDKLSMTICDFVDLAFGVDEFGDAYRLRGVYLTSATQEGAPIDQLTSELSELFGINEVEHSDVGGEGRSYFVRDLLLDKVFPEHFITGVSRRWDAIRGWGLRASVAVAALAIVASLLVWIAGFRTNQSTLTQVSAQANAISERLPADDVPLDVDAVLTYLAEFRRLDDAIEERRRGSAFGDYLWLSELPNMRDAARDAYSDALRNYFVPMIAAQFNNELEALGDNPQYGASEPWLNTHLSYHIVKYLRALAQPKQLNRPNLKEELLAGADELWRSAYVDDPDTLASIQQHLAHFNEAPVPAVNFQTAAASVALDNLIERDKAKLAYELLRAELDGVLGHDVNLRASPTEQGFATVFRWQGDGSALTIPGMYTVKGFERLVEGDDLKDFVAARRNEEWIFDGQSSWPGAGDLRKELERLYVQDYVRVWQRALDSLDVRPVTTSADSQLVVSILVGASSPLRILLQKIAEQTELIKASASDSSAATQAGARLIRRTAPARKLSRLTGGSGNQPADPRESVTEAFSELNALSDGGAGLTQVDGLLQQLAVILGPLHSTQANDQAFSQVIGIAATQPEPVKTWLTELVSASSAALQADREIREREERAEVREREEDQLAGIYRTDVLPLCSSALRGRFPVDPNAAQDVSFSDLRRLFDNGGELKRFTDEHLGPFIDRSARPWNWLATEDYDALTLPESLPRAMQRAAQIRRAYFPSPFELSIEPGDVDPDVTSFQLWVDDQSFEYRQGPVKPKSMSWPGPQPTGVRLVMQLGGGAEERKMYPGAWGWLRALRAAESITTQNNGGLAVVFNLNGRRAEVIVYPNRAMHPFRRNPLEGFRCPQL